MGAINRKRGCLSKEEENQFSFQIYVYKTTIQTLNISIISFLDGKMDAPMACFFLTQYD